MRRAVEDEDAKASVGVQQLSVDCTVNLSHFQDLLKEIDNTLRALPATGQVWHSQTAAVHVVRHDSPSYTGHISYANQRNIYIWHIQSLLLFA